MSRTIYIYNRFNLGDNLIFLHLLRALSKTRVSTPFVHFCNGCHIVQLQEVVADLPNILLEPFESELWKQHEGEAVDTWKNSGGFWEQSAQRWDWSAFQLEHHAWVAGRMGFVSPFTCREHLLFDAPCIQRKEVFAEHDFLIGDSEPCSGQFKPMAQHGIGYLDPLVSLLSESGLGVLTSEFKARGMTLAQIAGVSQSCTHHIMVAGGPFWLTMNTWNHHHHQGRRRIVFLDNGEQLNMPHIEQVSTREEVFQIAKEEGWV